MMCLLTFFFLLQENHQHIRMRGDSWPCKEFQGFHKAKKKGGGRVHTQGCGTRVQLFILPHRLPNFPLKKGNFLHRNQLHYETGSCRLIHQSIVIIHHIFMKLRMKFLELNRDLKGTTEHSA